MLVVTISLWADMMHVRGSIRDNNETLHASTYDALSNLERTVDNISEVQRAEWKAHYDMRAMQDGVINRGECP